MKKPRNRTIITLALILMMTFSAFMICLPTAAAESNVANAKQQYEAFRYTNGVTQYAYTSQYNSKDATGITASNGPQTNHTLWTKQIQRVTGSVVAQGKIWLNSNDPLPTLMCLDAYTGETIWKLTSTIKVTSTSAPYLELSTDRINIGYLYAIFNGALGCYQASDGAVVWEVPVSKFKDFIGQSTPMGANFAFVGPTSDKYIFTGDYFAGQPQDPAGAHVWAISKGRSGGKIAWATGVSNETDYWEGGPATLANGILYAGEYITRSHMNAFNATTGQLLWSTLIGGYSTYASTYFDGKIYTNTSPGFNVPGGAIVALDATTGAIVWRFNTTGIPMSNPIIYQNTLYQAVFLDNKLYALDKNTGALLWSMDSAGGGRGMTLANGKIYGTAYGDTDLSGVFLHDGFFYCLDPSTNTLLWKYQLTSTGAYSRGFPVADGIAYAGSISGTFYAFGKGPTTTEMSVTDANVAKGTTIAVSGKIYDESPASTGAPVANSQVNLLAQKAGETTWSDIGTATTDGAGKFVSQWTPPSEGTYKVMAKFDGTNDYGWSSSTTVVQVNAATPSGATPVPASEVADQVVAKLPAYTMVDLALVIAIAVVAVLVIVVIILQVRKPKN